MKVVIEYCGACGYEARANGLATAIRNSIPGVNVELLCGGGGVFEVVRDGVSVFSKKALGRFPVDSKEVVEAL